MNGERRKRAGMARAAWRRQRVILGARIALLEAIQESPEGAATTDGATPPRQRTSAFPDHGKWRGSVVAGLTDVIYPAGVTRSRRPSRRAGLNIRWRARSRQAMAQRIET